MALLRWLAGSGVRLTMTLALAVFLAHLATELYVLSGGKPNFFQTLELTALDVKLRQSRPAPPERWEVAVVAIDEASIARLGRLPWSRARFGELVDRLTAAGATAIAFDVLFSDAAADVELATWRAANALASGAVGQVPDRSEAAWARLRAARPAIRGDAAVSAAGLALRDAALDVRTLLRDVGARAEAPDEDAAFAAAIARSGRVILPLSGLSRVEAEGFGAEAVSSLPSVAGSTIAEAWQSGGPFLARYPEPREVFESGPLTRFFGLRPPAAPLARATRHFGLINALPDKDGVIRRVPLLGAFRSTGAALPTLALKAAQLHRGAHPLELHVDELGNPTGLGFDGEEPVPLELGGTVALSWYGAFLEDGLPVVSVADVLEDKPAAAALKGKMVFIGVTAVGTGDQRVTPVNEFVPGVHVHATLAQNLLDRRFLSRPQLAVFLELCVFLAIGLVGGLVMTKRGPLGQVLVAGGLAAVWLLCDRFGFFAAGVHVYTVLPLLQIGLTLVLVALWRFLVEEREKRHTRRAFAQYLSPAVMNQVLENPEEYLRLGGRRYEATVLFSDIRGFTTISEALTPEVLGTLLNRYMTPMTNLVFEHGGTLDKYIGDAVMAFWGAPIEQSDHAVRACRTALQMIAKVEELNVEFKAAGLPHIAIGVGLSSGPMTIGNMGSHDHFAYTALGDRVNLGARLEGQTKEYGVAILVSEATYELVKGHMACRELGALRVKGKNEPVRIFELMAEGALSPERQRFVDTFHHALADFRGRRFTEARAGFEAALELAGAKGDKLSEDYVEQCEHLLLHPPPDGWDGVRVATSK